MVRVPKLPLSITAVDSNAPSSISTTDIDVRKASLDHCSTVLSRHSVWTLALEAAVDRICRGSEPRQPLPKTARSGGSRYGGQERRSRSCERRAEVFEPNRLPN